MQFTPRGGTVTISVSLGRCEKKPFPPPLLPRELLCDADRVVNDGVMDPMVSVDNVELTQHLFMHFSHYSPMVRTRYRVSCPAGLRPADCIVSQIIRVTDTGCGMTPEELGRLFKPFIQISAGGWALFGSTCVFYLLSMLWVAPKPNRCFTSHQPGICGCVLPILSVHEYAGHKQKGGGTGLGLFISRQIVEAQGGTLTASSDGPGRGSTFTISAPLRVFVPTVLPRHEPGPVVDTAVLAAELEASHLVCCTVQPRHMLDVAATAFTDRPPPQFARALEIAEASAGAWGATLVNGRPEGVGSARGTPESRSSSATASRSFGDRTARPSASGAAGRPRDRGRDRDRASGQRHAGETGSPRAVGAPGPVTADGSGGGGAALPGALRAPPTGTRQIFDPSTLGASPRIYAPPPQTTPCSRRMCLPARLPEGSQVHTTEAASAAPPSTVVAPRRLPSSPGRQSLRFLVVDDVASNRTLLRRTLLRLFPGCAVDEAEDGLEALKRVDRSEAVDATAPPPQSDFEMIEEEESAPASPPPLRLGYDVILMDGHMPICDGYEATRRLRQTLGYRGVIVGVTGNALDADRSEFIAQGADAVHVKPVSSVALAADIRRRLLLPEPPARPTSS